jgi:hypothetical protein
MQVLPYYRCFPLPDHDASLHNSYCFGDPRFTSLRRFAPNVLGIAAHPLHTGWGRYRDRPPSWRLALSYLHPVNANILSSKAEGTKAYTKSLTLE